MLERKTFRKFTDRLATVLLASIVSFVGALKLFLREMFTTTKLIEARPLNCANKRSSTPKESS